MQFCVALLSNYSLFPSFLELQPIPVSVPWNVLTHKIMLHLFSMVICLQAQCVEV